MAAQQRWLWPFFPARSPLGIGDWFGAVDIADGQSIKLPLVKNHWGEFKSYRGHMDSLRSTRAVREYYAPTANDLRLRAELFPYPEVLDQTGTSWERVRDELSKHGLKTGVLGKLTAVQLLTSLADIANKASLKCANCKAPLTLGRTVDVLTTNQKQQCQDCEDKARKRSEESIDIVLAPFEAQWSDQLQADATDSKQAQDVLKSARANSEGMTHDPGWAALRRVARRKWPSLEDADDVDIAVRVRKWLNEQAVVFDGKIDDPEMQRVLVPLETVIKRLGGTATPADLLNQARVIQKVSNADAKRFQTEPPTAKLIGRAYFYWAAYPLLLNMMGFQSDGWDKAETYPATSSLDHAHDQATRVLMTAVDTRLGIDSSTLYAAARLCRELHHSDFWRVFPHGHQHDYWPESLGSALLELPPDQRQAILAAHGIVRRLEIDIDRVDTPKLDVPLVDNLEARVDTDTMTSIDPGRAIARRLLANMPFFAVELLGNDLRTLAAWLSQRPEKLSKPSNGVHEIYDSIFTPQEEFFTWEEIAFLRRVVAFNREPLPIVVPANTPPSSCGDEYVTVRKGAIETAFGISDDTRKRRVKLPEGACDRIPVHPNDLKPDRNRLPRCQLPRSYCELHRIPYE